MKLLYTLALFLILTACTKEQTSYIPPHPEDGFFQQRAYPFTDVNQKVWRKALKEVKALENNEKRAQGVWRLSGPTNIGGRVTDIAINPNNSNIIFAATATGGIFKTTDRGKKWKAVFDEAGRLSLGSIAIAPSNSRVMYAGTGEANASAASGAFFGDGVYRSTDGGRFWENIGLNNSAHIGRVVVNPYSENSVLVAAAGALYSQNEERGLFETKDGGKTWNKLFYLDDATSCIDVVQHPQDTNIIYAVMWERLRFPWQRDYGGPNSGIYRTEDGGNSWKKLTEGLPVSDGQTGRIGLAIAPSDPNVLYTSFTRDSITNSFFGLYKSIDGGDTWQETSSFLLGGMYGSFGWYFGNLRVHPSNPANAYALGVSLYETMDSGDFWRRISIGVHPDQHALEFDLNDPNFMVLGNDGGIYLSEDAGNTWTKTTGLPITQFYESDVAQSDKGIISGGTQDNGTVMTTSGLNSDWEQVLGGDGFHVVIDPEFPEIMYAEYQWGSLFRSFNGFETSQWALNGVDRSDRNNWNTPFIIDPVNSATLYYGTHRLYRSTDRAGSWELISDDLTNGLHPSRGAYGTITTIAVSEADNQILYVGTDDGNVQTSKDGGLTWTLVSEQLPNRYISSVVCDRTDPAVAYVTLSGYRKSDYLSHVFKTIDGGNNWTDISANLPEVPINDLIIDDKDPNFLYVATDLGVWNTFNGGEEWYLLGKGLPNTVVTDLVLHKRNRGLFAATYGRSMYYYALDRYFPEVPIDTTGILHFVHRPSPTGNTVSCTVHANFSGKANLNIVDTDGRLVHTQQGVELTVGENVMSISTQFFNKSGVYFLNLKAGNQQLCESFVVF